MTGLFLMGVASLVECSAVGAFLATLAAIYKRRFNKQVLENTLKKTLGVSCMFMWIILAALTFGAVFDGLGAGRAIETLFIEKFSVSKDSTISVAELRCHEPNCPPVETVFTVRTSDGSIQDWRISKSASEIQIKDIEILYDKEK